MVKEPGPISRFGREPLNTPSVSEVLRWFRVARTLRKVITPNTNQRQDRDMDDEREQIVTGSDLTKALNDLVENAKSHGLVDSLIKNYLFEKIRKI